MPSLSRRSAVTKRAAILIFIRRLSCPLFAPDADYLITASSTSRQSLVLFDNYFRSSVSDRSWSHICSLEEMPNSLEANHRIQPVFKHGRSYHAYLASCYAYLAVFSTVKRIAASKFAVLQCFILYNLLQNNWASFFTRGISHNIQFVIVTFLQSTADDIIKIAYPAK